MSKSNYIDAAVYGEEYNKSYSQVIADIKAGNLDGKMENGAWWVENDDANLAHSSGTASQSNFKSLRNSPSPSSNGSKNNYGLMALYLLPLVFTIGLLTMGYLSSADKISIDEISMDDVYRKLLVIVPALILFSLFAWVSLKGAVSVVGIILLFVVFGFTWLSVPLAIGILISLRKLNDAGFFKYSHESDYDYRERYRELFRLNIDGSDPGATGQIDTNTNTNTNPWIF